VNAGAPIAIFAYNRPKHLQATLDSLSQCPEWPGSRVVIYSDGPRHATDVAAVAAVRALARSIDHARVEIIERDANLGLARSIIDGVTDVCERYGRAIVVEDDLRVATSFLGYLNRALDAYAPRTDVWQVSAHMFDVPEFATRKSSLLLPMTTTWGWATWQRAWREFRPEVPGWERLQSDRADRRRFNLDNSYDYYGMLRRQMAGRADSWGVRWYWTVFAAGGLGCFPPRSLVANAGMDGSGTHGRGAMRGFGGTIAGMQVPSLEIPPDASQCSESEFAAVKRAIWRQNGRWRGWTMDRLKAVADRARSVSTPPGSQ